MKEKGLLELEDKTSKNYALNPSSGEWFKGIEIVMAENGMGHYFGTIPRTPDIFSGMGSKENRLNYITVRLGFLKSVFSLLGIEHIELYRGMATESDWKSFDPKLFSSWTFSKEVAESFSSIDDEKRFKNLYFLKRSKPVNRLFMTYLETDAMNGQYLESEAVVLLQENDRRLF